MDSFSVITKDDFFITSVLSITWETLFIITPHAAYYLGNAFHYSTIDTGCRKTTLDFTRFANAATGYDKHRK